MAKFCNNGHQMEDSWDDCPYCQRTGYQRTGGPVAAGKTRLDTESPAPVTGVASPSLAVGGKTVILSALKKAPIVGWLVVMEGAQKGDDFRLRDGQNILGSGDGVDVQLRDVAVSAKHASIRYKEGVFALTDLDSTNGTFLNGEPAAKEPLKDSDMIRVGEVLLKFKCL